MAISSSIIQEYYHVVDYWAETDKDRTWKLAIWKVTYAEVDLVDKFLEIERSIYGQFDDIFFRFESRFTDTEEEFAASLWKEYASWFTEKVEEKYDILRALEKDGMLIHKYTPNTESEPTLSNLWKEMLRFKSCIKGLEDKSFCIYFPPGNPNGDMRSGLFKQMLQQEIPQGIRFVTIDYKESPKIKMEKSPAVKILKPRLHMNEALANGLAKQDNRNDLLAPENRFNKQVTVVMDCTAQKDKKLMDREVGKMIEYASELKDKAISISALFIATQAYYAIKEYSTCMKYCEKTEKETEQAMADEVPTGYSYWKMTLYMKASVLASQKNRNEAIQLYTRVAQEATKRKDPFAIMESYCMAGFLYYELGKLEKSFEYLLLSLTGGNYLAKDIRRSSNFLYASHLALHIGRKIRSPYEIGVLEKQLEVWLGQDWRELIDNPDMENASARRRASIFS